MLMQVTFLRSDKGEPSMSVTHPTEALSTIHRQPIPPDRQQLVPFLIGCAISAVVIVVSLAITGLPH